MTAQLDHHHHFTPRPDGGLHCDYCGYTCTPLEDAVAVKMAQQAGWIGGNVRNTFAWEMWIEDARAVIALVDQHRGIEEAMRRGAEAATRQHEEQP